MNRDAYVEPEEQFLGIVNQTDAQQIEQRQIADEELKVRRIYLQQLMDNPMFRDWLYGVLMEFGTFTNPMGVSPTGFPDPMATMHASGVKAAGWRLWEIFDEVAPERASQMRRQGFRPQA